jgi:hypothetical protein
MSRTRLIFVALGALSVFAVAAPAAQAQGTMAELGCVIPPGQVVHTSPPVNNIVNDVLNGGGPLDTGQGGFTFNGSAFCAGADVAGPGLIPAGEYNLDATGTYQNLLCGTGTASGTAVLDGTFGNTTLIDLTFGVTFAAGTGKLAIAVTGGVVQVGANTETVQGGEGDGVISIIPNPLLTGGGGNCITTDVNEFFINGGFETTLTG